MSIADEKKAARKHFISERKLFDSEYMRQASQNIRKGIFEFAVKMGADTVLLFYPIKNEPDLRDLVTMLNAQSICVGFPISMEETVSLDFRAVSSLSEMIEGTYGIPEPSKDAPTVMLSEHSVCVVPALAFDLEGGRLGYGKGYYDRFLSNFKGKSVGAAYSRSVTARLPRDKYDLCVDAIITEGGVILPDEIKKKVVHPPKKDG